MTMSVSSPSSCQRANISSSNVRLKLQLFPLDDLTRKKLEKEKRNPYLELILSHRKKIASVFKHLDRKWSCYDPASAELVLLPYDASEENMVDKLRWTKDSLLTAADIHALIGRPHAFRLRYGWFPCSEAHQEPSQSHMELNEVVRECAPQAEDTPEKLMNLPYIARPSNIDHCSHLAIPCKNQKGIASEAHPSVPSHAVEIMDLPTITATRNKAPGPSVALTGAHPKVEGVSTTNKGARIETEVSPLLQCWADNATSISVGDLFSQLSRDGMQEHTEGEPHFCEAIKCSQQLPFTCDSFDAAIAAYISQHDQRKMDNPSFWDAEVTRDTFSFPENISADLPVGNLQDVQKHVPMDPSPSSPHKPEVSAQNHNAVEDLLWSDSLGPMDLANPSTKNCAGDFIISDSLGAWNCLLPSSLDTFQSSQ